MRMAKRMFASFMFYSPPENEKGRPFRGGPQFYTDKVRRLERVLDAQVEAMHAVKRAARRLREIGGAGGAGETDLAGGIALVRDPRVVGVDVGALGQVVAIADAKLAAIRAVEVLVLVARILGANQTVADRDAATDHPVAHGVLGLRTCQLAIGRAAAGVVGQLVPQGGNLDHAEVVRTADLDDADVGGDVKVLAVGRFVVQGHSQGAVVVVELAQPQADVTAVLLIGRRALRVRAQAGGFVADQAGRVGKQGVEAAEVRRDVGNGVVAAGDLFVEDGHGVGHGAAAERVVLVDHAVTVAIDAAADEGAEAAGQADIRMTVPKRGSGGADRRGSAVVDGDAIFEFEDSLHAVAQVFGAPEADAAAGFDAGGQFMAGAVDDRTADRPDTAVAAAAVDEAVVDQAINGHVGLGEGGAGGQAGDGQGDEFLLHRNLLKVLRCKIRTVVDGTVRHCRRRLPFWKAGSDCARRHPGPTRKSCAKRAPARTSVVFLQQIAGAEGLRR